MAHIVKAYIEDFDRILPLLGHFKIPGMDGERWHEILAQRHSARFGHFGYVLAEGKRYVGFLGTFFHDTVIDGKEHCICNLFCWYVMEEYRQQSLLLLLSVLKEPDITITSLTPSEQAGPVLRQFRFRPLDDELILLPLIPLPAVHRRFRTVTAQDEIGSMLHGRDAELSAKLKGPWCSQALLADKRGSNEYCHIVFNKVKKRGIPLTQVLHLSRPDIFRKNIIRAGWFFFLKNRTFLTAVDRRILQEELPAGVLRYRLRLPRLFRSDTLSPGQIDNLFTELHFLKTI